MIYFEDYDFEGFHPTETGKGRKGVSYLNNVFTLDFEVSSIFRAEYGSEWVEYNSDVDDCYEKSSLLYLWQFSIDEIVVYGRYLEDLKLFWGKLFEGIKARPIVFVHNLSYEFQFLRNIIDDFVVFARKPLKPIYTVSVGMNMEFRCSYMLTNSSLKNLAKKYGVEDKLEMEYNVLRTPETVLSKEELDYAERDCIIVYRVICKMVEEYDFVSKIPVTQTGRVRKIIKGMCVKNRNYMRKMAERSAQNFEEHSRLVNTFKGGQTHANALHSNKILYDISSKDIASSYPFVMLTESFPIAGFMESKHVRKFEHMRSEMAYIMRVTFYGVRSKLFNHYISSSWLTKDSSLWKEDNGKVIKGEKVTIWINEIDLEIMQWNYEWDDYDICEVYYSRKIRLTTPGLIEYLAELYENKTVLKDVEGMEDDYARSKEYINCLYGMMVTCVIKDEALFDRNGWSVYKLNESDVNKKIEEILGNGNGTFMLYQWGIWVTAYARRNLWSIISKIDGDVVYYDTDSVKYYSNEYNEAVFEMYNIQATEKLLVACDYWNIDFNRFIPKTPKGIRKQIGIYESERTYSRFITMGAKKYAYDFGEWLFDYQNMIWKPKCYVTVSGLNKEKATSNPYFRLEDFKEDYVFEVEYSGRLTASYIENQPIMHINGVEYTQFYGINMMPTTYTLGITSVYADYLTSLSNSESLDCSILG